MELLFAVTDFWYAWHCKATFKPEWMSTTSALLALFNVLGMIAILFYVSHRNRME